MDKFLNLIINPTSKDGLSSVSRIESILDAKGIQHNTYVCHERDQAREALIKICADGSHPNVIAVGGDGTFNNVINSIPDFDKVNVGFIPAGTGNDFALALGISHDPITAIDDILLGNIRNIDLIDVAGKICLNVTATGLDIEVLRTYNKMKHFKGKMKYNLALLKTLLSFGSYKAIIKIDGKEMQKDAFLVAAGNAKYFGGGMMVTPHGEIDDGKISVTIVNRLAKFKIPFVLLKFMKGKHDKIRKYCESYLCDEFEVVLPEEEVPAVNIDGEIFENHPYVCKVLPKKLRMFMPRKFIEKA